MLLRAARPAGSHRSQSGGRLGCEWARQRRATSGKMSHVSKPLDAHLLDGDKSFCSRPELSVVLSIYNNRAHQGGWQQHTRIYVPGVILQHQKSSLLDGNTPTQHSQSSGKAIWPLSPSNFFFFFLGSRCVQPGSIFINIPAHCAGL